MISLLPALVGERNSYARRDQVLFIHRIDAAEPEASPHNTLLIASALFWKVVQNPFNFSLSSETKISANCDGLSVADTCPVEVELGTIHFTQATKQPSDSASFQ